MSTPDWQRYGPLLEAALAHAGGTHGLSHIAAMVEAGEAQAWCGDQSIMITVIQDDPNERRLVIWLAGGDLRELVERLRPAAERWGRLNACRRVFIIGRPGWERVLANRGYAPLARITAKEL